MKTFAHILFGVLLILVAFILEGYESQNNKDRTVLNNFILGIDNSSTITKKIQIDELNVEFEYDGVAEVTKITTDQYLYKGTICKISLLLVDDNLYAVQYYPKNDKKIENYRKMLWTKYNVLDQSQNHFWFNSYIEVKYNEDGNNEASFIHYDLKLLKKYPQYKDKLY